MIEKPTVQLLHGDCLELMNEIPDKSIDMVLCDLPYGTTQNGWDCLINIQMLWEQYIRIVKDNGVTLLFAQTPFDKILGSSNIGMLRYEWIWNKDAGTGFLNANKMPLKSHENILVFYKILPTYNPQMRYGKPYSRKKSHHGTNYGNDSKDNIITRSSGGRYPTTVLTFKRDATNFHPTQKPVSLLEYLIRTYSNEGETILDNTMGSGSTGVAAINTSRNFIGIELYPLQNDDADYFGIATKRINQALDAWTPSLFSDDSASVKNKISEENNIELDIF